MEQTAAGLMIFVYIFLFVLAVLWLLMPFAVFGIKDRIRSLEQKSDAAYRQIMEINESLQSIDAGIRALVEQGKLGSRQDRQRKVPKPASEESLKNNPFIAGEK